MKKMWLVFCFGLAGMIMAVNAWAGSAVGSITSTTHAIGVSSSNNRIGVSWTAAPPPETGMLSGYGVAWSTATPPGAAFCQSLSPESTAAVSPELADGTWYFFIQAWYGSVASAISMLGPFLVNESHPDAPDTTFSDVCGCGAGNGGGTADCPFFYEVPTPDLDGDGDVDGSDLVRFAAPLLLDGVAAGIPLPGDFNADGVLDGEDLRIFAGRFGASP